MNNAPFFQQVLAAVRESQDGNTLNHKDHYGRFLLELIKDNTEPRPYDANAGTVNTEELADNLKYAILEFTKALKAVEKFNRAHS